MTNKKYKGVIVPMISPFTENGKIDERAVVRIINNFIIYDVQPFILGTTGESSSIEDYEKYQFAKIVANNFRDKTTLYVGIGSNSFSTSVDYAKRFYDLGFKIMVAHLPSYYPITESQILNYFEKLIEAIPGELMIYNITATTHISIPVNVVEKLSHHERIVGLKDSERDQERFDTLINMIKKREDFSHLIGWGAQSAHGLLIGSDGIVPSTGNLIPAMFKVMYDAAKNGDNKTAIQMQNLSNEVAEIYQKGRVLSESLAALKILMKTQGLCESNVLPPLTNLSDGEESKLIDQLNFIKQKQNIFNPEGVLS